MNKQYFVYVLKSLSGVLYIGITSNLIKRVWQHKQKLMDGFTKKYHVDISIYYEIFTDPTNAILRENNLKNGIGERN